ncbi:MAG: SLC13 family permease [Phycisphaeraceae bacterium]|nr:MAG: SLC13 family permease [Phycisphaeraceae bacterium]
MLNELLVFGVIVAAMGMFLWGRFRYDLVALMALLALVLLGITPADEAFVGFGHPAVITVAAILVVSRGLFNSGVVDMLAKTMKWAGENPTAQVISLTLLVAVCSGFMNNVGALALLMPVAVRMARSAGRSPSFLLMPLAFGSLLGGLTTLIGSPPNIIVATYRTEVVGEPFRMFDFTPVGVGVMLVGVAFIGLVGWRLIPKRSGQSSRDELFQINDYTAELLVDADSKIVGKRVRDIGQLVEAEVVVAAIVRGESRLPAPSPFETIRDGDIIVVEADHDGIKELADAAGLKLENDRQNEDNKEVESEKQRKNAGDEDKKKKKKKIEKGDRLRSDDVSLVECVVNADAPIAGRTAMQINARWRFGANLLAIARQGSRVKGRLRDTRIRAGDVLLFQIPTANVGDTMRALGCLPLAERDIGLGRQKRIAIALTIFLSALALVATGTLPVQIGFVLAAGLMAITGLVSLRDAYDSVEWPVIVLLGAMIPVGAALKSTGGAERIADGLMAASGSLPAIGALVALIVVTLLLSDVVNNAAAAVLMSPVAVAMAHGLETSVDPFLMGVVIGASSAFLTPIGHQSNTLVLGPGGYRFGDYWRMGLPLTVVYVAVAAPLIMVVWPM